MYTLAIRTDSGHAATSAGSAPRAPRQTAPSPRTRLPRASALPDTPTLAHICATVMLVLAVIGALLADRNRIEPVPGFGIIAQPGETTITTPNGLGPGDLAPNFRLRATSGEVVTLATLRGTPVVLAFWTTWCVACMDELDALQGLEDGDSKATVFGVNVGERSFRAREVAQRRHLSYPQLTDTDDEVAHHYGYWTYPVTVVIDANGAIIAVHTAPVSADTIAAELAAGSPAS